MNISRSGKFYFLRLAIVLYIANLLQLKKTASKYKNILLEKAGLLLDARIAAATVKTGLLGTIRLTDVELVKKSSVAVVTGMKLYLDLFRLLRGQLYIQRATVDTIKYNSSKPVPSFDFSTTVDGATKKGPEASRYYKQGIIF